MLPASAADHLPTPAPHPFSAQSLNDPTMQGYGWPHTTLPNPVPQCQFNSPQNLHEAIIRVAERGIRIVPSQPIVISPSTIQSGITRNASQVRADFGGPTSASAPTRTFPSLLMDPWSDKPRPDGSIMLPDNTIIHKTETAENKETNPDPPPKTKRSSDRSSYGYERDTVAVGISPRPLRRYSISTLASPGLNRDETLRDSMIERANSTRRVRLLTFESNFRKNDSRSLQRNSSVPGALTPPLSTPHNRKNLY
jgi:hypothetical protein